MNWQSIVNHFGNQVLTVATLRLNNHIHVCIQNQAIIMQVSEKVWSYSIHCQRLKSSVCFTNDAGAKKMASLQRTTYSIVETSRDLKLCSDNSSNAVMGKVWSTGHIGLFNGISNFMRKITFTKMFVYFHSHLFTNIFSFINKD